MINDENLIFYDIECFMYDSLVMFKDINKNLLGTFWNNREMKRAEDTSGFEGIPALVRDRTLVGFNNYHYDDAMLSRMYLGTFQRTIKRTNDLLIKGEYQNTEPVRQLLNTLDCMEGLNGVSLKQIEGNLGIDIRETSVDFDIDRPLTDEERERTEFYCSHDIDATIDVYKLRKHEHFETKTILVDMVNEIQKRYYTDSSQWFNEVMRFRTQRWNPRTLSTKLLLGVNGHIHRWAAIGCPNVEGYPVDEWKKVWRKVDGIPSAVWDNWEIANLEDKPRSKGVTVNKYGCTFVFGFGGLHAVNNSKNRFENVKLLDVVSMYPSIIIKLGILGDATAKYSQIKEDRIKIKRSGDKVLSDSYKLILNAVSGLLKMDGGKLYNPRANNTMCIYGQIVAFDLASRLDRAGYELVNVNTDGVAFVDNPVLNQSYKRVWKDWEAEYGLDLELDEFKWWWQRDVNNYAALTSAGKYKVKGGDVKRAFTEYPFANNSARIFDVVTIERLADPSKDTLEILIKYLDDDAFYDPGLWMFILKAGRTYNYVMDLRRGTKQQNVNRVFAVQEEYANIQLVKCKVNEDGSVSENAFPSAPDNQRLWNNDINMIDKTQFREQIDLEWYAKAINKRLKAWGCDKWLSSAM